MQCRSSHVGRYLAELLLLAGLGGAAVITPQPNASSHSDAPLIKQDPQSNLTDVYAFVGRKYNDPSQLVLDVLVSVRPFSDPGDGVIYERFADDALYSIHIANPVTGETVNRYDFRFSDVNPLSAPLLKNPDTILSYGLGTEAGSIKDIGDPRQNYTQTYSVSKNGVSLGTDLPIAPPNVGLRTTPAYNDPATGKAVSGATQFNELDLFTQQAISSLPSGVATFAGPRDDGFYADTPGLFDLLDPRIIDNNGNLADGLGQDGGGVDGFQGYNVLSFGIQIPISDLPSFPYSAPFSDLVSQLPSVGPANGVGVYASVSRPRITLRRTNHENVNSGPWIQINRLANPLFNEVLVALRDKDNYNRTDPSGDSQYATYAQNPEIARLINLVLFGNSSGDSPIATTGRSDLAAVFIPDVIRVDTTTPPVRLPGHSGFSRFGFIGGDTTTDSSGRVKSGGWPNGRRIGDDVVDIALTAVASGPIYTSVIAVGDNVAANDQVYHQVFPYLATPHAGPTTSMRQSP